MSQVIKQIEAILNLRLHEAPKRDGDPLAALMPFKENYPKYALDEAGHVIGLNLAKTGLTDVKCKEILDIKGLAGHLRALNLSQNELTVFPFPDGTGLRRLEQLNLAENRIREFSLPVGVDRLTDLDLEENPLISPPPDVLALGKVETLKWLTSKGKRPVLEAKIMFIGDSNYGKTHLIEMLRHQEIKREITTTHGIERCRMADAPSDQGPIRLNVWDLGGQQFMRSTHQFFFTERTLYVLVTVARRERKDLNHWLQLVHEIGGDAPVLVVINKTDLDDHDIDREPLRREYSNIKDFVRTAVYNSADGKVIALDTIQDLQHKIHAIVSDPTIMPSVFVEQRSEWFTVKRDLESMKDDFISYEKYSQLEHVKNLPDDEKRINLKQLASLGTVVSFVDDPRLSETHVINPQWIMDGVYKLINDAEVKDSRKGRFDFTDFKRLLPADRYPAGKYVFLVDLMQKFKLCYPVKGQNNTFLLPDLFSDIEPAGVWPEENKGLKMRLNYNSFPPDLFMAQFVVERYADIVDDKRWRSGVVVSDGKCTAIVRRSYAYEHIEIEVIGPEKQRRGYFHELLGEFRTLHKPFENIEVAREIPYEDKWLNYDDLLVFEEAGEPFFHPGLKKKIPVQEVLNGYKQPDNQDKIHEKLDYLIGSSTRIEHELFYLKILGEHKTKILEQLNNDKGTRDALFAKIEQGIAELSQKMPLDSPVIKETQKFKTAPDIKTKIKIGVNLILFALETEINWDMKAVFRQIADDMKNGHIFFKPGS